MVLVKIEPKEALCFIKLRQSIPHSWDMVGNEVGSEGGVMCVWFFTAYMGFFTGVEYDSYEQLK